MGTVRKEGAKPRAMIIGEPRDYNWRLPIEKMRLNLYPDEIDKKDIVGEKGYLDALKMHFGNRCLRGTALCFCPNPEVDRRLSICFEPFLRSVFGQLHPRRAVEIGTLFGVTTALLAHYSEEVVTIDVNYQQVSSYIWHYFGVDKKIRHIIIRNNEDKKELCGGFDFDFAFIDAEHTYEGVKLDFELVKKCGRVLFHDYGLNCHPGITDFVNELPKDEILTYRPFAYWEKKRKASIR